MEYAKLILKIYLSKAIRIKYKVNKDINEKSRNYVAIFLIIGPQITDEANDAFSFPNSSLENW